MGSNENWRQVRVRIDVVEKLGILSAELTEKRDADMALNNLSAPAQDVSLSDAIRFLLYQHENEKVRKKSYHQRRQQEKKRVG